MAALWELNEAGFATIHFECLQSHMNYAKKPALPKLQCQIWWVRCLIPKFGI